MIGPLSIYDPQLPKASKELFNLKTEKPFGLSMVLQQGRERASNSIFFNSLLTASNLFFFPFNKPEMWLNKGTADWLDSTSSI